MMYCKYSSKNPTVNDIVRMINEHKIPYGFPDEEGEDINDE